MSRGWVALTVATVLAFAAGATVAGQPFTWLELDSHPVKWGDPQPGSGTLVTYGYAISPVHSAGARNCRDIVPLDGLLERSAIPRATLEREAAVAFAMWQSVAGIRFRRVDDPNAAQILIGAQAKPHGVAFADVSYNPTGDGKVRSIRRSLVCLNPQTPWKVGFGDDLSIYDLRYALAHEIGHAIGLDHPSPSGQLMSFRYDEQFRELQPGDVAGAIALYGLAERAVADVAVPASIGLAPVAPVTSAVPVAGSAGLSLTPPHLPAHDGVR